MGSLFDAIKTASVKKGPPCAVSVFLATLAAPDAADLKAAIADESIACTTITKVVEERFSDTSLTEHVLRRHRRRKCQCHRTA